MASTAHDADVIVIGSGPGGLTCAAYLAAVGKRVLVFDRHWVAGGNATTFTHHGYEFDVGLHYIGECNPGGLVPRLLDPLGIEVRFREMDPDGFDTFLFPDLEFRWPRGIENLRARLHEAFPGERPAIDTFLDTLVGLNDSLFGLSEMGSFAGMVGSPRRLGRLGRHYFTTLGGFLDSLGVSPRLRQVLSAHSGIYAVAPSRASLLVHAAIVMHYDQGAYYPEGGAQVISDALVSFIRAHGGEVVLRTPVEKVLVENRRVRGVRVRPPAPARHAGAPEEYTAPVVVSNADLKRTYLELVGTEHLPARVVRRTRRFRMALPIFVEYLVLDRDLRAEGYRNTNLNVMSGDVDRYYADLEAGRMPEDLPAFLCSATLKDPGNPRPARPGQTNVQVMTLAPRDHDFWGVHEGPAGGERYRRNLAYVARKQAYGDAVLQQAERAVPGLRESIVYREAATPITHERFMGSTGGTSYGMECTPDQFLLGRPFPLTPVRGLYLTGANTTFGHGVVATMMGGMLTASMAVDGPLRFLRGGTLADRLAGRVPRAPAERETAGV